MIQGAPPGGDAWVTVLVPVLGRPSRVAPLLDSLFRPVRFVRVDVLFLLSPDDEGEAAAIHGMQETREDPIHAVVVDWPVGPGDYARKINHGAKLSEAEFVFLGADDLVFHPGWAERALACHLETHACVIGTNDLGNARVMNGDHSTHSLVRRDYLECGTIDEPGLLLHEGYKHNFCDTEMVETAITRETYWHATDCHVEHLHPLWAKAPNDPTYMLGQAGFAADQFLFQQRRRLWFEA